MAQDMHRSSKVMTDGAPCAFSNVDISFQDGALYFVAPHDCVHQYGSDWYFGQRDGLYSHCKVGFVKNLKSQDKSHLMFKRTLMVFHLPFTAASLK